MDAIEAPKHARTSADRRRTLKQYGLSPMDYAVRVLRQGGKCPICKQKPETNLHVDHDHVTGKVRKLLCRKCNAGLGFFDDDPKRLVAAATYRQQFQRSS